MSPDPLRASLVRYTLCNLNRIGAYLRPCLTALSLFTLLVSPWSNRTFNTEERLHHVNSEYYKPSLKSRIRGTAVSSVIMQRVGRVVVGVAATIDASIFKCINTDSGANPASSSIGIGSSLLGRKEDGA